MSFDYEEGLDLIQRETETKEERRLRRKKEMRAILQQEDHSPYSRITAKHKDSISTACRYLEKVIDDLPFEPGTEDERSVFRAYSILSSIK